LTGIGTVCMPGSEVRDVGHAQSSLVAPSVM
jgi:hypothetical protein